MSPPRRVAIPPVPRSAATSDRHLFDSAVKESLEVLRGEIGDRLTELDPASATLDDVIAKLNELIVLLQGSR